MARIAGFIMLALAVLLPFVTTLLVVTLLPASDEERGMLPGLVVAVLSVPMFVVGRALRQRKASEESADASVLVGGEPVPDGRPAPPSWQYDAETATYYFWDGLRFTTAARRSGSEWEYARIRTAADKRARTALRWAVSAWVIGLMTGPLGSVYVWFMLLPALVAGYLVVDTFRLARRSGEVESPIAWFVLAMVLFALLAVAYYGI